MPPINPNFEKVFICRCGHREWLEDIHSIADYTGDEFWGDVCDGCFGDMDIEIDKESKVSTWKFKSEQAQLRFEKYRK